VGQTIHLSPFNATGHPALTLPIGTLPPAEDDIITSQDREIKFPIGMQIVGKWWGEDTIYRVAQAWEQSFDWKAL
jgi:amidase